MIVCHCRVVSDRDVTEAISDGARTTAAVCRRTGAAQDCGTCIFTVKALVCEHQEVEQTILEVEGAAS
ncbi:(2Fe-2S)-binding protein [Nocardioides sp. YIM 152588]|uniref:(2Fe-2S)-binding protein n=1 Tax=Nocardioides sp. YIM 152588 TaxID=3158259 RepID=UPI0032E3BE66